MKHSTRSDILIGSTLCTVAMALTYVLHVPLWVFIWLLLAGAVLMGEATRTNYAFQNAARVERTAQVMAKVELSKPRPITITQDSVPKAIRNMVFDWHAGKDTTKRHALSLGVTEAQWTAAVRWAVDNQLGELVPAEGGSRKLRWLTGSLNDVLPALDQLAVLA